MILHDYLLANTASPALATTVSALAEAAIHIADLAAQNGLPAHMSGQMSLGAVAGSVNEDGDDQKQLDILADRLIQAALQDAGAAYYFSEEEAEPLCFDEAGELAVASDPLDGSSNIDTNASIGTIFSIFPADKIKDNLPPLGREQLAAGFFIYGPQTVLLLSFGKEVAAFALTPDKAFVKMTWDVAIPRQASEFAINASNAAYWHPKIAEFIDDAIYGAGKETSNMRWIGSLVADAYRIFRRGGIFLYPADARPAYAQGRLRLVYEANPIAFLIEAAGGVASNGEAPILDMAVTSLHQRTPLLFGSADQLAPLLPSTHSPS